MLKKHKIHKLLKQGGANLPELSAEKNPDNY